MRNTDDVLSFEWRSLHQRVWGFPLTTYLPSKRQALYSAYWQYSMQRFIFYLYFTLPTQYKKIGVLPTSGIWSRSNVSNESVRQRETFIVINCLLWTRLYEVTWFILINFSSVYILYIWKNVTHQVGISELITSCDINQVLTWENAIRVPIPLQGKLF